MAVDIWRDHEEKDHKPINVTHKTPLPNLQKHLRASQILQRPANFTSIQRSRLPPCRSSSSVRVPGATASPHRLSLTLSLCCARWFRHRAGRCHRAVPEAEAVERLRGVDEPLRALGRKHGQSGVWTVWTDGRVARSHIEASRV